MSEDEEATLQPGELSLDDAVDTDAPEHENEQEHSPEDHDDVSEKRVKDAQRAFHEEAKKRAELEKQIEKMSGQLSTLTELYGRPAPTKEQPQEDLFGFLDDKEFKEKLLDSPDNIVEMVKRVLGGVGSTIDSSHRYLSSEINRRDPAITSVAEKIRSFREENPDFGDFTDAQIARIVKRESGESPEPAKKSKSLSIGNRSGATPKEDEDLKKEVDFWYDRIGYNSYAKLDAQRRKNK